MLSEIKEEGANKSSALWSGWHTDANASRLQIITRILGFKGAESRVVSPDYFVTTKEAHSSSSGYLWETILYVQSG